MQYIVITVIDVLEPDKLMEAARESLREDEREDEIDELTLSKAIGVLSEADRAVAPLDCGFEVVERNVIVR